MSAIKLRKLSKRVIDYKVVVVTGRIFEYRSSQFEKDVNEYIKKGYQPYGYAGFFMGGCDDKSYNLVQPLILYEKED